MHWSLLYTVFACVTACLAAPTSGNHHYVLHEKRHASPHQWTKRSRAHAHEVIPIRIGLTQRNLHRAEEFILDVSDPSSPNFGKHWTAEQVANTFAPSREVTDEVEAWLIRSGIPSDRLSYSTGRNWVQFDATVAEAEVLFQTKYYFYQHDESKGYRIACDEYHLPSSIKSHIDFAMPTIQLEGMRPIPNIHPALSAPTPIQGLTGLANCSRLITIECLRAIYQFGAGNTSHTGNEIGIGEWADFLYLPDLDIFFNNFTTPKIPAGTRPEFISIDGGQTANFTYNNQTGAGVESALDFDTVYSIVYPQKVRLYQVGDGVNVDSVGTFNIFLDALDASYCTYLGGDQPYIDPAYPDPNEGGYTGPLQCGGAPISNVFSFSYNQIEAALPESYQYRQCYEWMKMGLQGVSVLFASGDSGVANRYNSGYKNSCLRTEGPYVDINGTRFSPSFPTNCPYITAVGATDLLGGRNGTITGGEMAVASPNKDPGLDYYSGGGFSNVFELPSYQATAVTNYLQKYPPPYTSAVYNNTGKSRAYPDLSALGLNLATVWLGKGYGVGGTSASTPIVAGLITLLNEARLEAGKGPVGFLNPTLYAHPEMFNDITVGGNPGCGTKGFSCQPGWDPVTGLGTPIYPKMKEVFMNLP